jgi:hypothetical protein
MAAPFTDTAKIGVDLNGVTTAAQLAAGQTGDARLGAQIFGSNGRLYVYGQANASITASTTACTVNATTFLVTASGGSYTSPAVALASGDRAWFSKASV